MLKAILIYDDRGIPLFIHKFDISINIDDVLISGLLRAIESIGEKIFNQNIANIEYSGEHGDIKNKIAIITKKMFYNDRKTFFVYFFHGNIEFKRIRALTNLIYLETKEFLYQNMVDQKPITNKIIPIVENNW